MAVSASRTQREYWNARGLALLWGAMAAGPLAWIFNQGVGYALMKPVCAGAAAYVLWLIAGASFVMAGAGAFIGWRCLHALRATATEDGGAVPDRSYFVAIVAIGLDLLIALLIVTSLFPQFFLSPCE